MYRFMFSAIHRDTRKKWAGSLALPAFFVTFAVRNEILKTMEENKNNQQQGLQIELTPDVAQG